MDVSFATPCKIKNRGNGNLIRQNDQHKKNNGLYSYDGNDITVDESWVFLKYDENKFKIINLFYSDWCIANDGVNNVYAQRSFPQNAGQFWSIENSVIENTSVFYFRNIGTNLILSCGNSDNGLATVYQTNNDPIAYWELSLGRTG
jgi:hypothetical protein